MKFRASVGSPAALLAIGAGVFIAALGFTGTWSQVFDILRGGKEAIEDLPENVGIHRCSQDSDCTDGKTCQGGVCQNPPGNNPGGTTRCDFNTQCKRGWTCQNNKCASLETPGNEGVCPENRVGILVASTEGGETLKCALPTDLVAARQGQCGAGMIQVTRVDAKRVVCWKAVRGAGRGPVASYYDESPTGVTTLRGAPRERL